MSISNQDFHINTKKITSISWPKGSEKYIGTENTNDSNLTKKNNHICSTKDSYLHFHKKQLEVFYSKVGEAMTKKAIIATFVELTRRNTFLNFHTDFNFKKRKFCENIQGPIFRRDNDETVDGDVMKAFNKYNTFVVKNTKEFRDAAVQTMSANETIDKQSQCDFREKKMLNSFLNSSSLDEHMKMNVDVYSSLNDSTILKESAVSKFLEAKGNESKYWKSEKSTALMTTSRIRIGLSKRVRPRHLHTN